MAEILVRADESIEGACKRFARSVAHDGVLSVYKRSRSYMSPGEKRRAKSAKAQKRARRAAIRLKKLKEPADDKSAGYQFWNDDIAHGWPIDLASKPAEKQSAEPEPVPAEEPSAYASCVLEYTDQNGNSGVILVKNLPDPDDQDSKSKKRRFGFPGGEVKIGETIEDAVVREAWEETGFDVIVVELIYSETIGNHTKYFFIGRIIGGSPVKGGEIEKMELRSIPSLETLIGMGYLRSSHMRAFLAFLERRKS